MNLRFLKVLVAVMGAMLVVGVVVLAVTIAARLGHRTAPPAIAFTAPPIALPAGATIERISTGSDRIVVAVMLGDGTRELLVIDLQTGRLLGTIPLRQR
ncbi:MAG TPA: DUF6476 family protein [Stellaceae bacterium]|nr:DUF6476 family protein [Stellaceae bacterium]